jgi:uncharacterized RDD family membrane protein YckC
MSNQTDEITISNQRGYYAGFISRALAFIVDTVLLSLSFIFLAWLINFLTFTMNLNATMNYLSQNVFPGLQPILEFIRSPLFQALLSFVIIMSYYVICWSVAGESIGKALFGLKIVPLRGGRLSFRRSIIRYLSYYLSGIAFGLGFIWVLVDDRRLAWHDKIARTCVIYTWEARPDEMFLSRALKQLNARSQALKRLLRRKSKKSTGQSSESIEALDFQALAEKAFMEENNLQETNIHK